MSTTWTARPTTYKGIRMRSRLEARMAADIDALGDPWEYEPRAYANERGQYLPDFQIHLPGFEHHPWFLEVKPTEDAAFLAMERMQIIWDSEPDAILTIIIPDEGTRWRAFSADGAKGRKWSAV